MINGINSGRVQLGPSSSGSAIEKIDSKAQHIDKQHGTQLSANINRIAQQGAPVDDARVESLRKNISEGSYELKPNRIADAILNFHNIGEPE